jgi:steroid delta-isomerase-like uncharacterized protein
MLLERHDQPRLISVPPEEVAMTDRIRALAERWFEDLWNRRRDETIDELMAPDAVGHMEGAPDVHGRADFRKVRDTLLGAFPDMRIVVEDVLSDDTRAVVRWHLTASHKGDHFGFPATNRPVAFSGLTWLTFRDGQIVEGCDAWNQGAVMQALQSR